MLQSLSHFALPFSRACARTFLCLRLRGADAAFGHPPRDFRLLSLERQLSRSRSPRAICRLPSPVVWSEVSDNHLRARVPPGLCLRRLGRMLRPGRIPPDARRPGISCIALPRRWLMSAAAGLSFPSRRCHPSPTRPWLWCRKMLRRRRLRFLSFCLCPTRSARVSSGLGYSVVK